MKKEHTIIGLVLAGIICMEPLSAHDVGRAHRHGDPNQPKPEDLPKLSDEQALRIGAYVLGYQQGRGIHSNGFNDTEISKEQFMKGLTAGMKGENSTISEPEMRAALAALQKMSQQRALAKQKAKFAGKIKKNKEFLTANAKREGVKTLPSGLQYEVLQKGGKKKYVAPVGDKPDTNTKFILHYKGTLISGKEFDSSTKHNPDGKPAE
ncbi:MAG: FKBP-type peptidyl-prolyl cis-trans isomerase N-terminal domain-containing protein, partial [Akkermansiaceae bacterium]